MNEIASDSLPSAADWVYSNSVNESSADGVTSDRSSGAQRMLLQKAMEYLDAGRAEEARELLNERAKHGSPDMSRDTLYLLAIAEAETGRYQASAGILSYLRRRWPDDRSIEETLRQVSNTKVVQTQFLRRQLLGDRALYLDYPKHVSIETTARCNAKCDFCAHEGLERRNEGMDDGLFSKILDDLTEIPPHIPFAICPSFIGETFIDRKIFERMRLINDRLPNADIIIISNMNVLPKKFFENLKTVKNIRGMRVSLFSVDKEEYERVYKVDHSRTIKNVLALLEFNKSERVIKKPILFTRCASGNEKDKKFLEESSDFLKNYQRARDYQVFVGPEKMGVAHVDPFKRPIPRHQIPYNKPCDKWFKITVMVNGIVPLCCMDPHGKFALGDVKEHSLLSIYNAGWFRTVRETALNRETVFPCNQCDMGHGEVEI